MAYNPANPFQDMFSGGNRSYNQAPSKESSFGLAFNPYYVAGAQSGQWQPITTNDQGALRVDIGTGISISANISGLSVTVGNVAVTGGQIGITGDVTVNGFSTLTGQVAQLQVAVDALTGTLTSKWQKTKNVGFASVYGAVTGSALVNKIQGYSQTTDVPSFIQVFDSATAPNSGDAPDFVVSVQKNNWFIDLAEAGVEFTQGVQVVNSVTPDIYLGGSTEDFIASVIFKLSP